MTTWCMSIHGESAKKVEKGGRGIKLTVSATSAAPFLPYGAEASCRQERLSQFREGQLYRENGSREKVFKAQLLRVSCYNY